MSRESSTKLKKVIFGVMALFIIWSIALSLSEQTSKTSITTYTNTSSASEGISAKKVELP